MRRLPIVLILLIGFCSTELVSAEGRCPDGYFPVGGGNAGWEGCAPMGGSIEPEEEMWRPPSEQWEARWGAIATGHGGGFGAVENARSKRVAERQAMAQCKKVSDVPNPECKAFTYSNQCGAYAWGVQGGEKVSASRLVDAEAEALRRCQARSGRCQVYYGDCSFGVRVR